MSSIAGAVQLIHTPVLPTSPVPAGGIACKVCSVLISSLVLLISIHRCLLQNSDDQSAVQMIIHGCFCLLRNLQINILFELYRREKVLRISAVCLSMFCAITGASACYVMPPNPFYVTAKSSNDLLCNSSSLIVSVVGFC